MARNTGASGLLREGLARLFRDGGHHVVATLRDADQAPHLCEQHTAPRPRYDPAEAVRRSTLVAWLRVLSA